MNTHSHHNQHPSVGRYPDRPVHSTPVRVSSGQTDEPSGNTTGGFLSVLRSYPLTLAVTVLTALALVTIACFVAYRCPDSASLTFPASCIVLALASLAGGITAGKRNPNSPVTASLLCGGLTAALLIVLSWILDGEGGLIPWAMRLSPLPMHLLGGVLTRPRKKAPVHTAARHPSRR